MTITSIWRPALGRGLALAALLLGGAGATRAQTLNYNIFGASNVAGTYTDLGTNGTVIPTSNQDDANSTPQDIGFTFNYNGTAFTQFVLNTNGFIKLGSTAPAAPDYYIVDGSPTFLDGVLTNEANVIAPFNFDLSPGSAGNTEFRVATTGTAPNRVCTVQWKNMQDFADVVTTQYANFSFQAKLYETTGVIEFVYGPATAGGTAAFRTAQVGLRGTSFAAGQVVFAAKASATLWSGAVFQDYNNTTSGTTSPTLNFRSNVLPDAGRTFRFAPALANDAAVTGIYTLGKILTPAGLPHAVQARITNVGSAALSTAFNVTLNVTGANTFTSTKSVASLAAGASTVVVFDNYPATLATGTNTVRVSLPDDNNNGNNVLATPQAVTTTTLAYNAPGQTVATNGGIGFNVGAGGIFAAKYTTSTTLPIYSVSVFIPASAAATTSVGRTIYAVALSSTGAVLGRSDNYIVQAADVDRYKTLLINTSVSVPAGDFYVGIAQPAPTVAFFPVGLQFETPTRAGAFFTLPLAGGTATDAAAQGFGVFMIEANRDVVTATQSAALSRATSVYPNPSETGQFNVAINGANSPDGLEAQVTDALGRVVFAGRVRDNYTTVLDLSQLGTGLYQLTLRNGTELLTRRLSIVK